MKFVHVCILSHHIDLLLFVIPTFPNYQGMHHKEVQPQLLLAVALIPTLAMEAMAGFSS